MRSSRGWASPACGPNGKLRDECLNETLFTSVAHARAELADWQHDYNTVRPHSKLGGRTPPRSQNKQCRAMPRHCLSSLQPSVKQCKDSTSDWEQSGEHVTTDPTWQLIGCFGWMASGWRNATA